MSHASNLAAAFARMTLPTRRRWPRRCSAGPQDLADRCNQNVAVHFEPGHNWRIQLASL